jgi:hypothetical protein
MLGLSCSSSLEVKSQFLTGDRGIGSPTHKVSILQQELITTKTGYKKIKNFSSFLTGILYLFNK